MLKRQRQASPPPSSSSSIPLITDSTDLIDRGGKRRRTESQSLFSGTSSHHSTWFAGQRNHEQDDDEEDYVSDDDPMSDVHAAPQMPPSTEYKIANDLLRELHTLHQHRLLFHVPPSHASSLTSTHGPNFTQSSTMHPLITQSKTILSPPPAPLHRSFPHAPPPSKLTEVHQNAMLSHEAQHVQERYEPTNRLLGSLFLSRRRALDPSDNTST